MGYDEDVAALRKKIDALNEDIVEKLAERVEVALEIGEVKARYGRLITDPTREAKVIEQVGEMARIRGIDVEGVERVFREIIRLCAEAEKGARP